MKLQSIIKYRIKKNRKQYNFDSSSQLGTVPLETVQDLHVPTTEDWQEVLIIKYYYIIFKFK